jgi:5,10-methylenetetrahydromethanopterin reductase
MIGATGDQMMEMTGEIADGVVLNYCVAPKYNEKAMDLLQAGLKKANKTLDNLDRPQLIVCSVDMDHDKAIDTTRGLLTQYLAQQPHIAKASGVAEEVVKEIQSILGWPATKEQINKAKHLVPEQLILDITASGTPDEAKAKVAEYRKYGCTCPILYPVGGDVRLLVDTFSQK